VPGYTDFIRAREIDLTRDDIAALCKRARLSKHAEKWIQIKYRLCNFSLYSEKEAGMFVEEDDTLSEKERKKREADTEEWYKSLNCLNVWEPDFIPDRVIVDLKACLRLVKDAFRDAQEFIEEYPELKPYKRASFLNFDFLVARFFFLICPCGDHGRSPECYHCRYNWTLKTLSTRNNIRTHVAWWYFLVGAVQRNTLYSHPELPHVSWGICHEDELIVSPAYAPKCPSLLQRALPTLPNPALQCLPLKSFGPRYLRLYPRARQTVTSCEPKSPRLTTSPSFWWESP
jgi:hypothetical protein